jgi:two-component system chemotaxis response regulator CheB
MVRDVIAIGAPQGGAAAVIQVLDGIPADLPAAIFVVLHSHPEQPILLADAVNAPGRMRAAEAVNGEPVQTRRIYVASDGKHLVVDRGVVRVTQEPEENGCRPSIDVLFRSAARSYDGRVVAIALLHLQKDGSAGLLEVRKNGGLALTHRNPRMLAPPPGRTGELLSDAHIDLEEIAPRILQYVRGESDGR